MDAIEAMRLGLGSGVILSYVLQGMYHPARRVREVYWRMYSECVDANCVLTILDTLILGSSDAMVPFYPALGSVPDLAAGQDYTRHHLMMFI